MRPSLVVPLAAALLVLAGCGGSDDEPGDGGGEQEGASDAAVACRDDWRDFGEALQEARPDGGEDAATPSMLPSRWVTLAAEVDYYAGSASAADCEERLPAAQRTVRQLTDFGESLQRYDMERRLAGYERGAALAAYARPSGREGRAAPSARQVRTALTDLRRLAPQATGEQSAAWQQAGVVELGDAEAREQAVADLRVVSGESEAYRDAAAAARLLDRAVAATE
ncbi:hypothetical protein [Nocardioides aequoreus]|uniref:hypothetical protein n=1 Tax=Nocardioides aequoreus TaxID=397278 RepID=UPI0004C445BC|nr:hypothetical protein [Nocardioides aequoreus]